MTAISPTSRARTNRPVVTYGLIAANVLAYLLSAQASGSFTDNMLSLQVRELALSEVATANGWWWTAVTSGFLHFGLVHLVVNMYSLYVLGASLELGLGRARYTAVYAISLLGGSACVLWFGLHGSITAGASGAIFGLMGASLVLVLKLKLNPTALLVVIGANVVASVAIPGISLLGHLGGLVAGAVAAAGLVYAPELLPRASRTRQKVGAVGWTCAAVVAAIVIVAIAVRFATYPAAVVYTIRSAG